MSSKTTVPIAGRVPNEVKEMWENALKMGHSTMRGILTDMADKLHSGELEFQDDKVVLQQPYSEESEYDLNNLIDACENKGVKVQDAIDKAAQMVWRG